MVAGIRTLLDEAFEGTPEAARRLSVSPAAAGIADELVAERPWRWLSSEETAAIPAHAGVVVPPLGDSPGPVLAALREVLSGTRNGGALVLAASVVSVPGETTLGLSSLLEVVQLASGGLLQLEDIRSQRWAGEALHRAVLLRFTILGPGERA